MPGPAAWEIIDRLAQRYVGGPYPRDEERVVYVVDVDHAVIVDFG